MGILIFCLFTFTLSGCYYSRVLKVKEQMRSPKENFVLSNKDNFTMIFLNPVLLEKDIEKIMNSRGLTEIKTEYSNKIEYLFVKKTLDGIINEVDNIPISFEFIDGKLVKYVSNKEFPKIFSKDFLNYALKKIGKAEINRKKISITIELDDNLKEIENIVFPRTYNFITFLGNPTTESTEDNKINYFYEYKLVGRDKNRLKMQIDMDFNRDSLKLRKIKFKLDGFKIL